jgi:hypothetical protein
MNAKTGVPRLLDMQDTYTTIDSMHCPPDIGVFEGNVDPKRGGSGRIGGWKGGGKKNWKGESAGAL